MNPLILDWTNLRNNTHTFICFVRGDHKSEWQLRLASTYMLVTALVLPLTTATVAALAVAENPFATHTLPHFAIASILSGVLYALHHRGSIRFIGLYLVVLYLLLSGGLTWSIGIEVSSMIPNACAVILAGTLCGYRSALVPATISTVFLVVFRAAELRGMVHPAHAALHLPTNFYTVVLLAFLFYVLAVVSDYLYCLREAHYKLEQAREQLEHQDEQLPNHRFAGKIKLQNQKLQSAEVEKMRQLYRLAEAGEVSTVLVHDLANSLTALTLEIDNIATHQDSNKHTNESRAAIRRAKAQIRQINTALKRTRQHIKDEQGPNVIDVAEQIGRTITLLHATAKQAHVKLQWDKPDKGKPYACLGEEVLLQQLLTNIITNAIESYGPLSLRTRHAQTVRHTSSARPRQMLRLRPDPQQHHSQKNRASQSSKDHCVHITLSAQTTNLQITITDWGTGIAPEVADKVFEPFYTTKKGGTGMGMYLTRRFIEGTFGGTITLDSSEEHTTFIVTLPQASKS